MRRITIGIDGYNLAMPNGTGVASYGYVLAQTLSAAGHRIEGIFGVDAGRDPSLREVLFFDRLGASPTGPRTRWQRRAATLRRWAEVSNPRSSASADDVPQTGQVERRAFASRLPDFARLTTSPALFDLAHRRFARTGRFTTLRMPNPPEIMHWTYPVPVALAGARNIYTMHDLVPLRLPYTTLDNKNHYAKLIRACARRADHICTVSEASRADIVAFTGLSASQVSNTYQASALPAPADMRDADTDAAIVEGIFGLRVRSYFLFFGALEPKKNVGRLLQAYLGLKLDTPLVIVGARAWKSEGELVLLQMQDEAEDGDRTARIIRLDYQPRDLLIKLVRGARGVLFPSLFEGFGLPALEAMQLGTAVLTSDTASLPEVVGDAALTVDPYDVEAIAAGLKRLDTDAALRTRLEERGPMQAAQFARPRYLERLEAMYSGVLGGR